jgi:hypothetical protein
MGEVEAMSTAEDMSDEELDVWADIFYQAKVGGVTEVTFSQFISNPFMHLGLAFHEVDRPQHEKQHLRLAYSNDATPKPKPFSGTELNPQPSEFPE